MKYEDYSLVSINIIVFIVLIFIMISVSFILRINTYTNYKMIYVSNNTYEIIVSSKELKSFYNNGSLYLNNKKYNYKIDRVNKNILIKNNNSYHELFIKIKYNKYKVNDVVDISLFKNKIRIIDMFIDIWKN